MKKDYKLLLEKELWEKMQDIKVKKNLTNNQLMELLLRSYNGN